MRRISLVVAVAALLPAVVTWRPAVAQSGQSLQYTVVFSDSQGVTHFRDEQLPWQVQTPAYSSSSALMTPYQDAEKIGFFRLPHGFRSDWHPAPSKRFAMLLTGASEIEVGYGQRRTFRPGSVVLVTDTTGRGHRTNVIGSDDTLSVWVPVP